MNRAPSLVTTLRCPHCHRVYRGADWQIGWGFLKCWHPRCGERWWVMPLSPGAVEPQLREAFGPLAFVLMEDYGLPATITEPMFWQLALRQHEATLHITKRSTPLRLFYLVGALRFAS